MKRRSEPDGMYTRDLVEIEPGDTNAELQAVAPTTVRGKLRQIAAEAERVLADVEEQAMDESDPRKLEHMERRKRDLRGLLQLIAIAEAALGEGDAERAAWWCLNAGLQTHRALFSRAVEPDVLFVRSNRTSGGRGSAATQAAESAAHDAKFKSLYQKRVDELMRDGMGYGDACKATASHFRRNHPDDRKRSRHSKDRVQELTKPKIRER